MSHKLQHSRGSSVNVSFSAADSKRQLQSIIGKPQNNKTDSKSFVESQRRQLLSEKDALLKEKQKFNEEKRKKLRSKSNAATSSGSGGSKSSSQVSNNNGKLVAEQQKISTEWMKISKDRDGLDEERIDLQKDRLALSKQRTEMDQQLKVMAEQSERLQSMHKKWEREKDELLRVVQEKYTAFSALIDDNEQLQVNANSSKEIAQRRQSLTKHINKLANMELEIPALSLTEIAAVTHAAESSSNNLAVTPVNTGRRQSRARSRTRSIADASEDVATERLRLNRLQKEAQEAQKRAEKTLKELYRKKQELKKEQTQLEMDQKKFQRFQADYEEFIKERKRLKKDKKTLAQTKKKQQVMNQKKSKRQLLDATHLQHEKDELLNTKRVLQQKQSRLQLENRKSVHASTLNLMDNKKFRAMKKKVAMYQEQVDALENANKILQRKLNKAEMFANDYDQDLQANDEASAQQNAKYLISALRSKLLELQNKNKLLTKLIKRQQNVHGAYQNINDLKAAKKLISKLVLDNEELTKRSNTLSERLARQKELGAQYQSELYKQYDDDGDDDEDGKDNASLELNVELMEGDEVTSLFESMKQKVAELLSEREELERTLQQKETEVFKFESYANEWDVQHRLGPERDKALYAKLQIENERLQNKLDTVYARLEKEIAAAATWQSTIEEQLMRSESLHVGEDEKVLLITQLKQENKALKAELGFNNSDGIKRHKAIAMDINEQFGTGLFNNLQFILMDADVNNDDIVKLKIKDRNGEIFSVLLVKQNENENETAGAENVAENENEQRKESKEDDGGNDEEEEEKADASEQLHSTAASNVNVNEMVKPIASQQKQMVQRLQDIQGVVNGYDERIQRIVNMLHHIKMSRKVLDWNAIQNEAKSSKPRFDMVVSEIRDRDSQQQQQQQQRSNGSKNNGASHLNPRHRNESLESLDSVYDLSHDGGLTRYGMNIHDAQQSVDVNSRISIFNRTNSAHSNASVYMPGHHGASDSQQSHATQKESDEAMARLTEGDVANIFAYYDKNGDGSISVRELIEVFKQLGVDVNDTEKMQSIIASLDVDSDGIVTKDNFIHWWFSSSAADHMLAFDSALRSLLSLHARKFHGQKTDELHAFAQYLNRIFRDEHDQVIDAVLDRYLPIDPADDGHDLLSKLVDGVMLAKVINFAVPSTIDERVLHLRDDKHDTILPKQIIENLNIVLSSCKAIGINFGVIESSNLSVETFLDPQQYEDIIRQILSELSNIHLSKKINLKDNPVLIRLAEVYEDDETIRALSSEDWLKRWVNYQLKRSGEDVKIRNFGKDFRNGTVLCHVLDSVTKRKKRKHDRFDADAAFQHPTYARPGYVIKVLQQQFYLRVFLSANDILSGNSRLIKLLCAQIFDKFTGMRKITKQEIEQVREIFKEDDNNNDGGVGDNGGSSHGGGGVAMSGASQVMVNDQYTVQVQFADEQKNMHNKYKKGDWDTRSGRKRKRNGRSGSNLSQKSDSGGGNASPASTGKNDDAAAAAANMIAAAAASKDDKTTTTTTSESAELQVNPIERAIREEKDIVNWMNEIFSASKLMDPRTKQVLKIYNVTKDMKSGLVLLYFMHLMEPDIVDWNNVNQPSDDGTRLSRNQCLSNCHYVISVIKKEPLCSSFFDIESLPNDGNDIYNGKKDVVFKICRNLINYHYIKTLSELLGFKATEFDILHWTNEQLKKKLKYPRFCSFEEKKLHQFADKSLKSCLFYIDLLLMLMDDPRNEPNLREIVIHKNNRQFRDDDYTKSECLSNARYALSLSRKFGCVLYLSPYDLVNVRSPEITMSFVMCIMVLILTKQQKDKENGSAAAVVKSSSSSKLNKLGKSSDDKKEDIIENLNIHLEQTSDHGSAISNDEQTTGGPKHGRKRSVLLEFGVITGDNALQEIQLLSRQYSQPTIVTPRPYRNSSFENNLSAVAEKK
eukprot:CAMPEP_0202689364 /NCGR_PEP_ID=MMETSP1385-20130828/4639_1 /ASSEMBLY_ACC=CAM_ASM_000861 /TAXON_ID=933848 /ORGANISM="Elphidium margaritaceum" /LENGTH=1934 /DNA_ID=CAMNT_0049344485 /DNA_START=27 /DNA_END=5831 /DNA_ORIENTATION=+